MIDSDVVESAESTQLDARTIGFSTDDTRSTRDAIVDKCTTHPLGEKEKTTPNNE